MRQFQDTIKSGDEGDSYFVAWLIKKGFTDIRRTDRYCHWDLEAKYRGNIWVFEMKNRTFPTFTYGDVFLNKDKWEYLKEIPEKAVLVTFYTDKWLMIDIKSREPDEITQQVCRRQTVFDDHRMIKKDVVKWYLEGLKLLDYD